MLGVVEGCFQCHSAAVVVRVMREGNEKLTGGEEGLGRVFEKE